MSTGLPEPTTTPHTEMVTPEEPGEVYLFSHSNFFYWWPVWAIGYLMALLTYLNGLYVAIPPGGQEYLIHPSKNVGVIYTFVFFLVIMMTNITLRGLTSAIVILSALLIALALAYFGWWEMVLGWLGILNIYMNMGFYVFFSTLIFLVWFTSVFIYDRMSYWRIRPGQLMHETVFGGGEKSYDTRGMVLEKLRQDLFRHWILGLGSGDIHITTTGAKREEIYIPNVLFVDAKVARIQKLIAIKPEEIVQARS
jgi:hypothetical protein